jgi:peroxin-1
MATTCEDCEHNARTAKHHKSDAVDGSVLFCQGSLISVEYMRLLGLKVPVSTNGFYRLGLKTNSSTRHEVEVGPIIRACDLAEVLGFEVGVVNAHVVTPDKETHPLNDSKTIRSLPSHLVLSDESILAFGVLSTSTIGISSIANTITSSASEIISRSSIFSRDVLLDTSRQMYVGIVGEEGSGKTHSALYTALRLSLEQTWAVVYLDCKKLQSSTQSTLVSILKEIQLVFDDAMFRQPSIIILDDLDCLIPNVESGDSGDGSIHHQMTNPALQSQVKVIVDHLMLLSHANTGVACLYTCRDMTSVSSRFMGMVHNVVETISFDAHQRTEFLCNHVLGSSMKYHEIPPYMSKLGRDTDGYRPRDLILIAKRIISAAQLRNLSDLDEGLEQENRRIEADIDDILTEFTPLSQQSLEISHSDSIVEWHSIGGLFRAKQLLHDTIIHPMRFRRVYNNAPIKLPTGLMIFGYPGQS